MIQINSLNLVICLLMIPINLKSSYKCFLELFRKKFISKEVYEYIHSVGSQRPRMYGLPKLHKPDVPLRPILSMCHSVQHSLAKWLVKLLNPVLEFYLGFCVKDSFTFAPIICQLPFCNDSQFLVSFDIVSLFTNIHMGETICADFLYRRPSTSVLPFLEDVFVELMEITTKSVSFSFNEVMYYQIDGISMGSRLGPILANIFVGFHERQLFEKYPKPCIYLRYVDDTFVSFSSCSEALKFFHKLNNLHPSLAFTMEEEKNDKLPFLDVLVERGESAVLTSIYIKPTFTELYLSWDASRKLNLIKCLSFRALNICSDSKIKDELRVIRELFLNNGYPEEVINDNTDLTVTKFSNKNKIFGPSKCPVYFRLPWIGPASQSFVDKIASSVSRFNTARSIFTTKVAFNSIHKDVLPIFNQSLLIYKFKCWCNSIYIGRTSQHLDVRIKHHIPWGVLNTERITSGHSQAIDSAIGKHLLSINSCRTRYQDDCWLFYIEPEVKSITIF